MTTMVMSQRWIDLSFSAGPIRMFDNPLKLEQGKQPVKMIMTTDTIVMIVNLIVVVIVMK